MAHPRGTPPLLRDASTGEDERDVPSWEAAHGKNAGAEAGRGSRGAPVFVRHRRARPDRRLQGAPRPWILREEFPRAALLEVDHQEARAREGALQLM